MTRGARSVAVLLVLASGCYEARPSLDGSPHCPPYFTDPLVAGDLSRYAIKNWGANVDNVEWAIKDLGLHYSGGLDTGGGDSYLLVGEERWTDYAVEVLATPLANVPGSAPMLSIGVVGRYQSQESHFKFAIQSGRAATLVGGERSPVLGSVPVLIHLAKTYALRLEMRGDRIRAYLDGELLFDVTSAVSSSGKAGLSAGCAANARFNDLVVRPLSCR